MPKVTILDMVSQRYPEIDPRYALLGLYYKQQSIYTVAEIIGCNASGISRLIKDIEKDMLINGYQNGK